MIDQSTFEQQSLIEDAARRFLEKNYSFEKHRKIIAKEPGYSTDHWREMAQLGWMLLPISAEFGGLGGSTALVLTLLKEFGRTLYVSPYLASAVTSARIIEKMAARPVGQQILEKIGSGEVIVSPAIYEPQARYDLNNVATTASTARGAILLSGAKTAVLYGNAASHLLVLAQNAGNHESHREFSLHLIPKDTEGVQLTHYRTHDGARASDVKLDNVESRDPQMIWQGEQTLTEISQAMNLANAAISAELVGAMEATLELTLDFVKTRTQFGQKLSSFQSLQHRLVDMYMRCQMAESLSRETARAIDSFRGAEQDIMVSAAKCEIARAALLNAEEAIQLHGAMGMMDEMAVGHYLKRVFSLSLLFGDADYHQARYRSLRLKAAS